MRLGREKAGKAPEFSAGNPTQVEIRQKNILRALQLRVTGSIVVTGGTGAGSYHTDAAYRIARILGIDYDGDTRINVHGPDLATLDALFQPKARTQTFPSSLTAGTYAFDVVYTVPFFMPHARKDLSQRFALPTRLVEAPVLRVQWANASELAYGTDATSIAFSGVQTEVYEVTMSGVMPAVPGQYWPLLMQTSLYRLLGTVAEEMHELPGWKSGQELRGVIATALANGASDVGYRASNSVLTKLGLTINGIPEFEAAPTSIIRGDNEVDYNLTAGPRTGVTVLDSAVDEDVSPHAMYNITRGLRPYVKFDAAFNGANGQHLLRFLTLGTQGRIPSI